MKQRNFSHPQGDVPVIINANDHHMALVFVLDVSYSMDGPPIDQLNEGINRFKAEVCSDKKTRDILDVAVIQFNDDYEVVQDFVPIEYMTPIHLEAEGGTKFTAPLREAMSMVSKRSILYRNSGTEPYKPWIIFVTDGEPLNEDITEIAQEMISMQASNKVRLIALGVGDYNSAKLKELTDVVFRMEGTDFTSFFDWVNKSMRSISLSSPGEKPQLPPLEGNVYRDVSDI